MLIRGIYVPAIVMQVYYFYIWKSAIYLCFCLKPEQLKCRILGEVGKTSESIKADIFNIMTRAIRLSISDLVNVKQKELYIAHKKKLVAWKYEWSIWNAF